MEQLIKRTETELYSKRAEPRPLVLSEPVPNPASLSPAPCYQTPYLLLFLFQTIGLLILLLTFSDLNSLLCYVLGLSSAVSLWSLVRQREKKLERLVNAITLERDNIAEQKDLISTHIAAAVLIENARGELLLCSPYTQVLSGYSLEEFYQEGASFFDSLILEEDLPRFERAKEIARLGEDISVKYRIKHKSGLELWLETRLVPILNANDELLSVLSVSIDVTDSLSYQRQIQEQNKDLNDFTFMVSHDLKAPIFTIKGMAAALKEDHAEALGKDGEELLQYIIEATARLDKLVASVIEYNSVSTKHLECSSVDLEEILSSVQADLSGQIHSLKALLILKTELPAIEANPVRLYQVFANLLSNALKYSSPERPPVIEISHRYLPAQHLLIEIRDNGLGIPSNKLADIFRPYHRAHSEGDGHGIGLACVKKIMERFGGSVSVKSTLGEGSTFSLLFPASENQQRALDLDIARSFR